MIPNLIYIRNFLKIQKTKTYQILWSHARPGRGQLADTASLSLLQTYLLYESRFTDRSTIYQYPKITGWEKPSVRGLLVKTRLPVYRSPYIGLSICQVPENKRNRCCDSESYRVYIYIYIAVIRIMYQLVDFFRVDRAIIFLPRFVEHFTNMKWNFDCKSCKLILFVYWNFN